MAQQLIVCSVKDRLANVYSHPMYFATEGQAIRAFQDALADPQNSMSKHPDDYDLYRLGVFDDELGRFHNDEQPKTLGLGKQLKNA